MTVTLKGFQGTVSDADMSTQLAVLPQHVYGAGDLAVSQVGSTRTIAVADGSGWGNFVRVILAGGWSTPLAPPTSGGKWYAIAVQRQWSPTNAAVFEAIDTGATTDGTVPTILPADLKLSAWYRNSPGTAGSTKDYGTHQILAFVHVRAADATLTIFDARVIRGAGSFRVATLSALAFHAIAGTFGGAALITVAPYGNPGSAHDRSVWASRADGLMIPVGTIIIGGGGIKTELNALTTAGRLGLYQNASRIYDYSSGVEERWGGTGWLPGTSANTLDAGVMVAGGRDGRQPAGVRGDGMVNGNWNTVTTPGMYKTDDTSTWNGPPGVFGEYQYGALNVFAGGADLSVVVQRYTADRVGTTWERESYSGGAGWTPWRKVAYIGDRTSGGDFVGQRAFDGFTELRWTNGRWQPWESAYASYALDIRNVNLGNGGNYVEAQWRWESGRVRVRGSFGFGAGGGIGGAISVNVPAKVTGATGYNQRDLTLEGQTTSKQASNGRVFTGPVFGFPGDQYRIQLGSAVANDTFAYATTLATNQPIDASQYNEVSWTAVYEDADNRL